MRGCVKCDEKLLSGVDSEPPTLTLTMASQPPRRPRHKIVSIVIIPLIHGEPRPRRPSHVSQGHITTQRPPPRRPRAELSSDGPVVPTQEAYLQKLGAHANFQETCPCTESSQQVAFQGDTGAASLATCDHAAPHRLHITLKQRVTASAPLTRDSFRVNKGTARE